MINNDLFITVVVMFLLAFVAVLLLLVISIFVCVNSYKQKSLKITRLQVILASISFIILYLTLPFGLLAASHKATQNDAEKLHKLAIKTAVIPSVKAEMLKELGSYYLISQQGEKALQFFENSVKTSENKEAISQLCLLYTVKGDYDLALSTCKKTGLEQIIAVNYILQEDYKKAYGVINVKMQKNKNKNITCWDYAIRGYINRKLGKRNLFEIDYAKAKKLCPDNQLLQELYQNENYYKDAYSKYRKYYNF